MTAAVGALFEAAERALRDGVDDPEVRLEQMRWLARHSPAGLALVASRGRWELARHLELINREVVDCIGRDDGRLILSVSVRAGKSLHAARWTPAWHIGMNPDDRIILGAHEGPFAAEHAGFARDVLTEFGPVLFDVAVNPASSARNRWDVLGRAGGMAAVGVGGSPIGKGADVMIIDDPLKSFEAAMSDEVRRRVNEVWFQSTMQSRVEPGGSIIVICSRWHEEDLSGWLMENQPGDWREVHIPALCDDPEGDLLGREVGESFWPERWPDHRLVRREREVGPTIWNAQYQQRPSAPAGGVFPVGKLRFVERAEVEWDRVVQWCRGWDLAATEGDGDFTVGVLLGRYDDDRWLVADVQRGQWGEAKVRSMIRQVANLDRGEYGCAMIELPQDPGSAGKSQAAQIAASLSGFLPRALPVTGSKEVRAAGVAAQVQMGNVDVIAGSSWVREFVEELRPFPRSRNDDQVDALSAAFNRLADVPMFDGDAWSGGDAFEGLTRAR